MSGYFTALIMIFTLLISGCSIKESTQSNQDGESFKGEDLLVLRTLVHQQNQEYIAAISLYKELYEKSGNIAYIKEALKISFLPENEQYLPELMEIAKAKAPNDPDVIRMQVGVLLKDKDLKKAEKIMLKLLEKE